MNNCPKPIQSPSPIAKKNYFEFNVPLCIVGDGSPTSRNTPTNVIVVKFTSVGQGLAPAGVFRLPCVL